jgi:aspartokinase-like uncharacterized kinase
MIVVKVGGSLYDLPDLGRRLLAFLSSLPGEDRLLVPGGGTAADVVRALDATHGLGEAMAHWLALRACTVNAHFLQALLPGAVIVGWPRSGVALTVLDPLAFVEADEGQPGCLPATWDASSDAVAGRAAEVARSELVLLKSATLPAGMAWSEAARRGFVDPVLPGIIARADLCVRAVNLRDWSG